MESASDRTRRIRALADFQSKLTNIDQTIATQTGEFHTGAIYGATVSLENGCCEPAPPPPTNYNAYFTINGSTRNGVASPFTIPATTPFTIEWWQTDVSLNAFQSRHIFSFGSYDTYDFACIFDQGGIIIKINGTTYPKYPSAIEYGSFESMLVPNHFAIVRANGTDTTIRVYKNGAFLGEVLYDGAISIVNSADKKMTVRNQTAACKLAQMYGDLPSFRWTAAELYTGYNYNPVGNFAPPPMPLLPLTGDILTINDFPTSGSTQTVEGYTVTHFEAAGLPAC